MPVIVAIKTHPGAILVITAMRAVELFAMYIVTTFALAYSVTKLQMSRDLFLNITFAVGVISCVTLPFFGWLADRIGFKRVYITGAVIGLLCTFPFFGCDGSPLGLLDRGVLAAVGQRRPRHGQLGAAAPVHQLLRHRIPYSGANVGYQIASVVFGGFTPFIATALLGINGTWYPVAIYMALGCLLSVAVAAQMRMRQ